MSERAEGRLSDRALQARLKDLDIKMEAEEAADLDALMRTDFGRRWFYRVVFLECKLESASYQPSGQLMSYLEGQRSIAIILRDKAQAVCPELWIHMLQERLSAAEQESALRRENQGSQGIGDV